MKPWFLYYSLLALFSAVGSDPAVYFTDQTNGPRTIVLQQGTPVTLQLNERVRSDEVQVGQTLQLSVKVAVERQGYRLVSTNAYAEGEVVHAQEARGFGRPAKLEIRAVNLQAVDGQRVPLYGKKLLKRGKKRKGLAWAVGILGSVAGVLVMSEVQNDDSSGLGATGVAFLATGFLVKGQEAQFDLGTVLTGVVQRDIAIEVES